MIYSIMENTRCLVSLIQLKNGRK